MNANGQAARAERATRAEAPDSLTGVFDLKRSGGSLGMLIILLEELEIQRTLHGAPSAELVMVGDAAQLLPGADAPEAGAPGEAGKLAVLASVARAMSGISGCRSWGPGEADLPADCRLWPDPALLVQERYSYDSTARIRNYFARTGSIPRLSVKPELLAQAKAYLEQHSGGRLPVAVHLKSSANQPGQSNADVASWRALFCCQEARGSHFFLLGDDAANAGFADLPNVTSAMSDGIRLDGYLALLQASRLFMGMMSGPSNMALFGETPYLIFKHPDHHAAEMKIELGDCDHYSFALAHQRVLREFDTAEHLNRAFTGAIRQVSR
jgi:hypothetical protein